ncbi:MAG: T9SS-dependent M36 family metallopeptidase [Thermonemataceae bacterium]|nr:T9SS-dependent M36 family metallopeptidase [Thermonemataceae bacterium]
MKKFLLFFLLTLAHFSLMAQKSANLEKALLFLNQQQGKNFPIQDWKVTDEVYDPRTKTTHLYLRQIFEGVEIYNSSVNFTIRNNKVLYATGKVYENIQKNTNSSFRLQATEAIKEVGKHLNLVPTQLNILPANQQNRAGFVLYSKANISYELIPTKQVYFLDEQNNTLQAAWNLSIAPIGSEDWWDIVIDANSAKILQQYNWTVKCTFDHSQTQVPQKHNHSVACTDTKQHTLHQQRNDGAVYNVFEFPIESPIHGNRTLATNPADATASPYGWHDTNGAAGAEYTITRGNNVYAYDDRANTNSAGFSPDGGVLLNFDFPYSTSTSPTDYLSFAVTNTFYASNMMHDIFYYVGFDEVSGNFQVNNYGRGGSGNDEVRAEAQDGSGTNNANFSTPPDGSSPRMQMYVWDGSRKYLTINSPAGIAGTYLTGTAQFGPTITSTATTGDLVLVNDGSAAPTEACVAMTAGSLTGKIAVLDRGNCSFVEKVKNAQNAGAIAVIVVNNVSGGVMTMGGTDATITIPSVLVSLEDGNTIKTSMQSNTVSGSLVATPVVNTDSDLDNGVIAHEFGHGISNRLTGGPSNTSCLTGDEQMGEGWSDYFALIISMKAGDYATQPRGIGTYVMGQPTNGLGIRPAQYTTDRAINNYTYADLPSTNLSIPHGVGFVWCTMLWDMTWKFVDRYGFDANLKTGTGGNRRALEMVMEGLKLQPCKPGFEDGRDAILRANRELYGSADADIIWAAFADRGLGYYADQGGSGSRADGEADFTIPPACPADAGNLSKPSSAPSNMQIEEGGDLNPFRKTYSGEKKKDPADPNNSYTFGENYGYAFLISRNDTIIAHSTTGDFDYTTLPAAKYLVWGFSLKTIPDDVATYLSTKTTITNVKDDISNGVICANLTNSYVNGAEASVTILAKNNEPLAIDEELKAKIQVYPNPSSTDFTLSMLEQSGKNFEMTILNVQGKTLYKRNFDVNSNNFKEKVSVKSWSKGIYILKLQTTNSVVYEKIVVE